MADQPLPWAMAGFAMRALLSVFVLMLALLAEAGPVGAKGDPAAIATPNIELVVFETSDCAYCLIFRKNIAQLYAQMPQSRSVPMRFVKLEDTATAGLELNGQVNIAPTIILIRDGQEIDRIIGYTAPELFFDMVNHLLAKQD